MKKYTKRFKNKKFNKTLKKGGGDTIDIPQQTDVSQEVLPQNNNDDDKATIKDVGVLGYLGDTVKSGLGKVATMAEDSLLNAAGLEKKDENNQNDNTSENNSLSGLASNISENIKNVTNKTGAAVIGNVNELFGSDAVKENVKEAAQNTVSILKDNAQIFNDAVNDPEVKGELIQAIKNGAEIGNVVIEAAKKPINNAAEVIAEAVPNAVAASSAGLVKVATDLVGAIPGIGGIMDGLKAFNDGSKAVAGVVKSASDTIVSVSDLVTDTKENFEKGMETLEKSKKLSQQISNRTTKSINDFENPYKFNNLNVQAAGGRKTKRRLFKRKFKSKRVRFAI